MVSELFDYILDMYPRDDTLEDIPQTQVWVRFELEYGSLHGSVFTTAPSKYHISKQTDRKKDRQTDRQTDKKQNKQ